MQAPLDVSCSSSRGSWKAARLAALYIFNSLLWFYGAYEKIRSEHVMILLPKTSVLYGAGLGALPHNLEVSTKWTL